MQRKTERIVSKKILFELRSIGVNRLYIYFDGCGDSGDINDIEYFDILDQPRSSEYMRTSSNIDNQLRDWSFELINDYTDEHGYDWINNDGGFGHLVVEVESGEYKLNFSQRVTEDMSWEGTI